MLRLWRRLMVYYQGGDEVEVLAESFAGSLLDGPSQAALAIHVCAKDRHKLSSDTFVAHRFPQSAIMWNNFRADWGDDKGQSPAAVAGVTAMPGEHRLRAYGHSDLNSRSLRCTQHRTSLPTLSISVPDPERPFIGNAPAGRCYDIRAV